MNIELIKKHLEQFNEFEVERYVKYLQYISNQKNKDQSLKNPWIKSRNDQYLIDCFKKVAKDGLVFDGENITLQKTGISYNYQAYKNKMLLTYPESIVDISLVYEKDTFTFRKESGKVFYSHDMNDVFGRNDSMIIGGYCVIKNRRGEFITTLTSDEIEKHRKVAKTDYIWKNWYPEMCIKTVIKKACSAHFKDIYQEIINTDNTENDIDNIFSSKRTVLFA